MDFMGKQICSVPSLIYRCMRSAASTSPLPLPQPHRWPTEGRLIFERNRLKTDLPKVGGFSNEIEEKNTAHPANPTSWYQKARRNY